VPRYAKAAQTEAKNPADEVWTIDLADGFLITLMSPARYLERYGSSAIKANDRHSFFGAIVFKTSDIRHIYDLVAPLTELRSRKDPNSVTVLAPCLNKLREFRGEP
jgi:hypothetical protein